MQHLKKIILTFFIIIIGLVVMEKVFDFFTLRNLNLKTSYITRQDINADLLIMGPCEPLWMINPDELDPIIKLKSFNLAASHSNFAENYLQLYLYLKHNKTPKYALLYVTMESMDGSFNLFNTYRYPQYLDDALIRETIADQDTSYMHYTWIPFMKYGYYNTLTMFNAFQGAKHFFSLKSKPYSENGFIRPRNISWVRFEKFVKKNPDGYDYQWNKHELFYLEKIIALAKRKNIDLILYESPFINEVKPLMKNRNEFLKKMNSIAYNNKIPYWVFDTMKISESRDYFFSNNNTNAIGSDIFVKTLGKYFNAKYALPIQDTIPKNNYLLN